MLSGVVGFIVSLAVAAYLSPKYPTNDFAISLLTVISGFIFSKVTFAILFHLDNRKRYTQRFTGKLNIPVLKQIIRKMIFADLVFDVVNNLSRFFVMFELLEIGYGAISATTITFLPENSLLPRN